MGTVLIDNFLLKNFLFYDSIKKKRKEEKMKTIVKQYKEELKKIFNDKWYMISVIITAILGFGYLITHTTIGMDDSSLDRYYSGFYEMNIISIVGRWGSYFLYKLLNITQFTPFWLEMLTVLTIIFTAIIITCFMNKNFKIKNKLVGIIFSCIYISYSMINEAMIFQPSNFSLIVGNLLAIISVILIYEMLNGKYSKINYIPIIIVLTLGISMYESCCQTFLVALLFVMLYDLITKKQTDKEMFKNFFIGIGVLVAGIVLNYIVLYFLFFLGVPNELDQMMGEKGINWTEYGLVEGVSVLTFYIKHYIIENLFYLPVLEFVVCLGIGLVFSIYYTIKTRNLYIFNIFVLSALSNVALAVLQCGPILYRTCTSLGLFVAAVFAFTYFVLSKKKYLKGIGLALAILIILWQTRDLNQWFYSENVKYQNDIKTGYQIAEDIRKEVIDLTKPLVFVGIPEKGFVIDGQRGAQSNGLYFVWWGQKAFDDNSYELIKFINSLGYYFRKPTDEQYEKGQLLAEEMKNYPKDGYIKEFQDIIVVKFNDK